MNLVSAGSFTMGRAGYRADEGPEHDVFLADFYLDVFEVTNQQFAVFLNDQGNQTEGGIKWLDEIAIEVRIHRVGGVWQPDLGYTDHPAVEMSWYGANAYCAWRGLDLPTEAQWEKAARADSDRLFPWGDEISCDLAQYGECGGQTRPVGSYPGGISPYGIHDMAGNAWEWTRDWYAPDYYTWTPDHDPAGPETGTFKVTRGGAWFYVADHQRTSFRNHARPKVSYSYVGFRCASTP
jgi:formylglycine-generating enzyme required for sulfatase activity